jgi:hypothetical protein
MASKPLKVADLMARFPLVVSWLHGGPVPQSKELVAYLVAWNESEPPNQMDWSGRVAAALASALEE